MTTLMLMPTLCCLAECPSPGYVILSLMPNGKQSSARKPGRPVNLPRQRMKDYFVRDQWSDRTFARAWRAIKAIIVFTDDPDAVTAAVKRSTRPNGSVNVAELTREAIRIQTEWDKAHPELAARLSAQLEQKIAARKRRKTAK